MEFSDIAEHGNRGRDWEFGRKRRHVTSCLPSRYHEGRQARAILKESHESAFQGILVC